MLSITVEDLAKRYSCFDLLAAYIMRECSCDVDTAMESSYRVMSAIDNIVDNDVYNREDE